MLAEIFRASDQVFDEDARLMFQRLGILLYGGSIERLLHERAVRLEPFVARTDCMYQCVLACDSCR